MTYAIETLARQRQQELLAEAASAALAREARAAAASGSAKTARVSSGKGLRQLSQHLVWLAQAARRARALTRTA